MSNPASPVGPWPDAEEVVLAGWIVPVWRPKFHRPIKFLDGGMFKFWALQDYRLAIVFREKVGFWVRRPGEELPWTLQDRICFMVKNHEMDQRLASMNEDDLRVNGAVDRQIQDWLRGHPKEQPLR